MTNPHIEANWEVYQGLSKQWGYSATYGVYNITSGAIEVGLDGDQAMKNIFGDWPLYPKQADYDLLKDLQEKIRKSPLKWTGPWVEGHQDNLSWFEDLDLWGQLNV